MPKFQHQIARFAVATLFAAALLFGSQIAEANGKPHPLYVPLSWQHVKIVSERFDIPFAAMMFLLHQENGYVGLKKPNPNGSFDYGPFQINSIHLKSPEYRKAGITEELLMWDARVNTLAAAYYLRKVSKNAENLFDAIGQYHSYTPAVKQRYQEAFLKRIKSFRNVEAAIASANRGFTNNK